MNLIINKKKIMGLKLIDIEIPVANKNGVIYSHLIPSIKNLEPIKDFVRLVLNFNGDTTKKDILAILKVCIKNKI